ncbi:MAG TPA: MBL fold metallo-hydrolase [Actinomycetota bacterium]|nr:MBL fold metallo-hydrolase [Actinomycetota bacterium]
MHRLSDSDSGPYIFDDVRALPTPGHTLGHCSFYFPERDTIIAGDALVTFDPYTRSRGPQIVSRAATADPQRAMESLSVLAETDARVILPGHGEPWSDGARRAVDLARSSGIT